MGWTPDQERAIEARGGQVLVSAAAGSGKTSVLTERVKNILCDTKDKCSVNEILVVTFTKAAAAEMKGRIGEALKKEIKNTNNAYIKEQLSMLPTADICTIDSFCARIVKENFSLCDISADYNMLTEGEEKSLLNECVDEILKEQYETEDADFALLNKMFLTERDDGNLQSVILSLYGFSRSYPNPGAWLRKITEYYKADINNTPWADIIYDYCIMMFSYHLQKLSRAVFLMNKDGNFKPEYVSYFSGLCNKITDMIGLCEKKLWDEFVLGIREWGFTTFRFQHRNADENVKQFSKNALKDFYDDTERLREKTLPTEAEHCEDCKILFPAVKKLCECTELLSEKSSEKKKELNKYSFDDILHKCIDILVEYKNGSFVPTELSYNLRSKYKEILIDEYQDTNEAQNIIFEAISNDMKNFYCVGDVKQSIYGFRHASPELFMNMKKKLPEYSGKAGAPSQISLNTNFRSRKGITETVNFAFSRLMSEKTGEITYDKKEYLNYGAKFSEKESPDCEFFYIDAAEFNSKEATELEAKRIASYIKSFISQNNTIYDKKTEKERKYNYGDFCILLRSMKDKAGVYSECLKKAGIPVFCEAESHTESTKEFNYLVSLFKAVCNPLLDVPLCAVMMSPIFGFSPDEMAKIRLVNSKADLYVCLSEYAKSNAKASAFLKKLSLYRNIGAVCTVEEFTDFVIEDTGIKDICLASENSNERLSVVKAVEETAKRFTADKKSGLSSFVRYLDMLTENGGLSRGSSFDGDGNSVKIMSVHKSKGLEFPCVIIADTFKDFNKTDSRGVITVSGKTGIGVKIRDDEKFTRYSTLSSAATEIAVQRGGMSEELRVLYVAVTRAREKLVVFLTNTSHKTMSKVNYFLSSSSDIVNRPVDPYLVFRASSVAQWLLYAFSLHSDFGELRKSANMNTLTVPDSGFRVKLVCEEADNTGFVTGTAEEQNTETDSDLLMQIKERAEYKYPFDVLNGIKGKRTASSLESVYGKSQFFASSRPKSLRGLLSAADRGNAVHKFMEKCNFERAVISLTSEIERLIVENVITPEEAVILNEKAINCFLHSDICQRLIKSENAVKEYEFSVLRNVRDIYTELPEEYSDEEIVVEGKLDCAFIENNKGIIIDYKTDNISDENALINMYRGQLLVYASAFAECEKIQIGEIYLYSFKMEKFIKIDM